MFTQAILHYQTHQNVCILCEVHNVTLEYACMSCHLKSYHFLPKKQELIGIVGQLDIRKLSYKNSSKMH